MITEEQQKALNEVCYHAVLHSRMLANKAHRCFNSGIRRKWALQIADLMDAIHNIPNHLKEPEKADLDFLPVCLDCCDKNWGEEKSFPHLRNIYENALRR